jgi:dCTP deaminase
VILCKEAILENYNKGIIVIEPFEMALMNPNSYDIRLGPELYRMKGRYGQRDLYHPDDSQWERVTPVTAKDIREGGMDGLPPYPKWAEGVIPDDCPVFRLEPGEFYLATTLESIGSRPPAPGEVAIVPEMKAKSTFGRQGLTVALCAGLGDVGYCSRWALEVRLAGRSVVPLAVGTPIGQVVFHDASPTECVYGGAGHYQNDGVVRFLPKPLRWQNPSSASNSLNCS